MPVPVLVLVLVEQRDVGYDNESSFSKAFKRTYGCSPGAFRTEWSA